MSSPFQIQIPKRSAICLKCQQQLLPKASYHSLIKESEEGIVRSDYCVDCWQALDKSEVGKTHWKSKVPTKREEKKDISRDEKALALLKELDPSEKMEAFVLALYLARRRLLYLRQQLKQQSGEKINLYEVAATEEMIVVPRISLSDLDVQAVQTRLAAKLK